MMKILELKDKYGDSSLGLYNYSKTTAKREDFEEIFGHAFEHEYQEGEGTPDDFLESFGFERIFVEEINL